MLARKGNQGTLSTAVEEAFIDADASDYEGTQRLGSNGVTPVSGKTALSEPASLDPPAAPDGT